MLIKHANSLIEDSHATDSRVFALAIREAPETAKPAEFKLNRLMLLCA